MPKTVTRTFELTEEHAAFFDSKVKSGAFRTVDEALATVVRDEIDREEQLDALMRDEVFPVIRKMDEEPGRGVLLDDVMADIRRRYSELTKAAE